MPSELIDLEIHAVAGVDKAANKRSWLIVKRDEVKDTELDKAVWSTAAVNDLPDSSFAYISPGGTKTDGKTDPRSLRHLPYKGADGKPDAAHVRNALARLSQTDIPASAKASAKRKLRAAAKSLGIETDTGEAKKSLFGLRKWLGQVLKSPNPYMWDVKGPYDFASVWGEWDDQAEYDMWSNMTNALRQAICSILDADMDEQTENDQIKASVMQFMECAQTAANEDAAEGEEDAAETAQMMKAVFAKAMQDMNDMQTTVPDEKTEKTPRKRKDGAAVNKTLADILKGLGIDVAKNVEEPETGDVTKRLSDAESVIKAEREERAKLEKRLADAEEAQRMAVLAKRAETEFTNLPGTNDEKAGILKALGTLPEADAKRLEQILKTASEAIRKAALIEIGKSGPEAGSAEAQIEARVSELVTKGNLSKAKAYAQFMETAEGKNLYKQYVAEQRGGVN